MSRATKGEDFVCASAGWLDIKTSATIEERCNNEFTFETLPCFDWIPEPTAFERPEQPNSHPDLGKGHVRKVGYRPRRASKILKLQTSRRHAKGIRDELGLLVPALKIAY